MTPAQHPSLLQGSSSMALKGWTTASSHPKAGNASQSRQDLSGPSLPPACSQLAATNLHSDVSLEDLHASRCEALYPCTPLCRASCNPGAKQAPGAAEHGSTAQLWEMEEPGTALQKRWGLYRAARAALPFRQCWEKLHSQALISLCPSPPQQCPALTQLLPFCLA